MVKKKIRRLYRVTKKDSIIGGVCAGIADYFDIDPTLIRLFWVLITIFSFGTGVFGYLILWMIMPRK